MNRRKAVALTVALASASAFAITSSVQAELGPNAAVAGDVRVTPFDNPLTPIDNLTPDGLSPVDGLNQPAPVVALGGTDQPGANAQIRIHNQWRSGDRVLFQVRDSVGNNCASVPTSVGYSATPTVVSSAVAYDFLGNSPMVLNTALPPTPDAPVASTGPQVKPEFQVKLLSSTQCAPNGVTDIVEILFTNQSANPALPGYDITDAWVLSLSGIKYNVGANVTAGPLRNLPLAQDATATPGIFINSPGGWFGGNLAAVGVTPLVQQMWTNTAFVLPVTLTAETPGTLVADGFAQDLGTVTLTESTVSSLLPGLTYRVCYSNNIGVIQLPVVGTGPVVTGSVQAVPGTNCIVFAVDGAKLSATAADKIVLSNIFAPVFSAGTTSVSLVEVPIAFQAAYLTPNDKGGAPASNSVNSDVNIVAPPYLTAVLGTATQLPDRIGGSNRYETASKIALSLGCGNFAVIVNGSSYPDALSATYLAGALREVYGNDVPILMSTTNSLPQATVLALRENGVRSVFVVGGDAVISQQVEDQLSGSRRYFCGGDAFDSNQNIVVNRVAGANRYATNNEVIEAVQSIFAGTFNNRLRYQAVPTAPSKRTALVATGENFADALIGGQFAYERFPLILTTGGALSPEALQSMTSVDIEQAIILGGESAVSADVATAIEDAGVTVIRLAGANRFETGVAVNNWALARAFPGDPAVIAADLPYDLGLGQFVNAPNGNAFIARGDNFADALASAPIVSQRNGLLTLSDQAVLSPATGAWLTATAPLFDQVTALGLGSAISANVLNAANAAVNP